MIIKANLNSDSVENLFLILLIKSTNVGGKSVYNMKYLYDLTKQRQNNEFKIYCPLPLHLNRDGLHWVTYNNYWENGFEMIHVPLNLITIFPIFFSLFTNKAHFVHTNLRLNLNCCAHYSFNFFVKQAKISRTI